MNKMSGPLIILILCLVSISVAREKPHIVYVLADDLGFNDIGYNDPQVITPNINDLAANGVILERNYVQPVCTPSRTALLTGTYPYKIGMQVSKIINYMSSFLLFLSRDLHLEAMSLMDYLWTKLYFLNTYNHKAIKLIWLESKVQELLWWEPKHFEFQMAFGIL